MSRLRAATVALSCLGLAEAALASQEFTVPCTECVVWQLPPEHAKSLLEQPALLAGLRILIDGEDVEAAQSLAGRGADVGIRLSSTSTALADPLPAWLVVPTLAGEGDEALAFRLKALTSDLRARRDDIRIGLEVSAERLRRLAGGDDVVAYLDFFVVLPGEAAPERLPQAWLRLGEAVDSLAALADVSAGGATVILEWPGSAAGPLAWARLASALGPDPVGTPSPAWRCARDDRDVPCRVRSFVESTAQERVVWVDADEAVGRIAGVRERPVGAVSLDGQVVEPVTPGGSAALAIDPPARSFLLRFAADAEEDRARFHAELEVVAERSWTAAEILARHRAADQGRRRRVPRFIATGDTTITFTLPGLSAPATVTSRTVLYEDGARREVEQLDLRWNGTPVPLDGGRVPRLPIVEPAAAEPPLAIRLTEAYSYRLEGRDDVDGRPAYVLSFEPRAGAGPHGRAFIDADDFGLSRLETVRAGLPGPIVSSEQRDAFTRHQVAGRPAWLLARSEIHQTYEGPGHRTAIHRLVRFDRVEPNPVDFQVRRARAHAGGAVLMRETPEGFRYLAAGPTGTERRLAGRSDSVRTVALGVTVDPNVDGALPFGGVGYLDLDLFGTGAQVNAFAGVGFVQASFAAPRLGRTRWQAHATAFAVLVRYNDRAFREGVEDYGETLRQRPSRVTLGVSRPLTARSRVRVSYELEHNALMRSYLTTPGYVAPVSPLAHGLRVELEARRGAWTGVAFGSTSRRARWEAWGPRDHLQPAPETRELRTIRRLARPQPGRHASSDRPAGRFVDVGTRPGSLQPLRDRLLPEPPARLSGRQPPLRPGPAAARTGQCRLPPRAAGRSLPRRGLPARSRLRRGAQDVSRPGHRPGTGAAQGGAAGGRGRLRIRWP